MRWFFFLVSLIVVFNFAKADCPDEVNKISLKEVEKSLKADGVEIFIHGAVPRFKLFVGTYRSPKNFFKYIDFSLLTMDKKVVPQLMTLKRHDKILVKGEFLETESCFPHVIVNEMKMLKAFETNPKMPKYKHRADLSKLEDVDRIVGKVHGVSYAQGVLAVEYKDAVVPVFVPETHHKLLEKVYRNDVIDIAVFVRINPDRPIHVELDIDKKNPLIQKVSMVEGHGDEIKLTGELVMFPKSPQIRFDIYALRVKGKLGFERNYTLVNFESTETFLKIREYLEGLWKQNQKTAVGGRNFWVNPKVKIEATGVKNVISPTQANPQILLKGIESLKILK